LFSGFSFEQSRQLDGVRVRELEAENATLRAHVDKLMQRVHNLPSSESHVSSSSTTTTNTATTIPSLSSSSSVSASDLHALQSRLAGLKDQLGSSASITSHNALYSCFQFDSWQRTLDSATKE
jgi:hypothetical protein